MNNGNANSSNNVDKISCSRLEIYRILRGYVVHENALINNRLGWLLAIQGFLFAGYGLILKEGIKNPYCFWFVIIIFFMGISSSIIVFFETVGAHESIESLKIYWENNKEEDKIVIKDLPELTGGSPKDKKNKKLRLHRAAYGIPIVFFIAWCVLILVTIQF